MIETHCDAAADHLYHLQIHGFGLSQRNEQRTTKHKQYCPIPLLPYTTAEWRSYNYNQNRVIFFYLFIYFFFWLIYTVSNKNLQVIWCLGMSVKSILRYNYNIYGWANITNLRKIVRIIYFFSTTFWRCCGLNIFIQELRYCLEYKFWKY